MDALGYLDEAWRELTAPGADFELETISVGGEPARIYRNAPKTVRDLWLPTSVFGDRPYLVYQQERLTYAEAHAAAAAVGHWLLGNGVAPGDRVAIAMRNYPEWMLIYWGCVSVGICAVGVNAWWTGEEMAYALADSEPKILFCDAERLQRILPHAERFKDTRIVVTRTSDAPADAVQLDAVLAGGGVLPEVAIDPDADACIIYTSGTTGYPKGAQLTHRNCVTNLWNMQFAGQVQALALQRMDGPPAAPPAQSVALISTPFFHVTGNNCLAYSATVRGATMVLMYRWDPTEALALIERERVTEVSGVPVMSREILGHPDFARYDTSSVVSMGGGGAPLQEDLVGKIAGQMENARPRTGYGMTETSGLISSITGRFLLDKPSSVGRPLPTFDLRFLDEEGVDVPAGAVGEICVRGAAVIKGYLNQPEATAETIPDRWLRTGDLGRLDEDGFLHIVDRKKDMVLRGGENVYCVEVENAIQEHADVVECCVFGIPDERLGEAVAAAVLPRDGAGLDAEALAAHCARRLAAHKIPSRIWFLDQPIPRSATGKFVKRELRDRLLQGAGRG